MKSQSIPLFENNIKKGKRPPVGFLSATPATIIAPVYYRHLIFFYCKHSLYYYRRQLIEMATFTALLLKVLAVWWISFLPYAPQRTNIMPPLSAVPSRKPVTHWSLWVVSGQWYQIDEAKKPSPECRVFLKQSSPWDLVQTGPKVVLSPVLPMARTLTPVIYSRYTNISHVMN